MADSVLAAGAVLYRPAPDPSVPGDGIEICVVHRPAYDDWSLPKGKLEDDEHPLAAAAREVAEETGFTGRPEIRLPQVAYTLPDGRDKTVDFWLMRASDKPVAAIADPDEVDEIAWLRPAEALSRLDYPADRCLVEHVAGLPPITAITPLVRHAHAGNRKQWDGEDALRPLDDNGRAEAALLAELLPLFEPTQFVAATPLRCRQTLEPAATRLGQPIVMDSAFAEPADLAEVPARVRFAAQRLAELRDGPTTAICSQGKVMPPLLAHLHDEDDPEPYKTPKGGGWLLAWSGGGLAALSRL